MEKRIFSSVSLFLSLLCFSYYLLCGFLYSFSLSILYAWLLAGAAFFAAALCHRRFSRFAAVRAVLKIFWCLVGVFLLLYLVFSLCILSHAFSSPSEKPDAILVLGARNYGDSSAEMDVRADKAFELMQEFPDCPVVLSGGRVFDEKETEAAYLKRKLLEMGAKEDRLILEEKSETTRENLLFSLPLSEGENIVIVTGAFHAFRTRKLASSLGTEKNFFLAPKSEPSLLIPHRILREMATFSVDLFRGNIKL